MALVVLITGATGTASRVYALARYTAEVLDTQGHTTVIVDPGRVPADIVSAVAASDAVVLVSPGTVLDLLAPGALSGKTVLPVVTGETPSSLEAAETALRPVVSALGADQILRGAHIPDHDLASHGCGAVLAPDADDALRLALDGLSPDRRSADEDDALLISAEQAVAGHEAGALLLDVRRGDDRAHQIDGVLHVEKDQLAEFFDPSSAKAPAVRPDHPIVVFCNRERGSAKAVRLLRALGFTDVRHVRGGSAELARAQRDRYAHIG